MRIEVVTDVNATEWQRLVSKDPKATFFHTHEWGQCVQSIFRGWNRFFLTARSDGELLAALPAMRLSKRGVFAMMSMPFGTYGGPLVAEGAPPGIGDDLSRRFFEAARPARVAFAELVDFPAQLAGVPFKRMRSVEDEARVLSLDPGYENLFRGFKDTNRNKIRKAEKSGVKVRRAESREDFLAYDAVLSECSRRWEEPTQFHREFFDALWALHNGGIQMWLAEHDGRVIAGLLNFAHNESVMNWGTVSMPSARQLAPVNLLHARAIEHAVDHGFSLYNFGSSAGLTGVDSFKATFGARRLRYYHHVLEKRWFPMFRRWSRRRRTDYKTYRSNAGSVAEHVEKPRESVTVGP
ncbi:MAG: lipid II:glycine glycyltransferase FemX [Candidatus Krumholzibacteriia bacterium]